jgi:hypothetical protein
VKTNAAVGELLRAKMVSAMRCGKPLVIVCGDEFPDFHVKYAMDEKFGITWNEVLHWEPFRVKE